MGLCKWLLLVLLALGTSPLAGAADLIEIYHAAQSQDAVFASTNSDWWPNSHRLTLGMGLGTYTGVVVWTASWATIKSLTFTNVLVLAAPPTKYIVLNTNFQWSVQDATNRFAVFGANGWTAP